MENENDLFMFLEGLINVEIKTEVLKEFAKKCFEAGRAFGYDSCLANQDGGEPINPDFETFYQNLNK